MFNRVKLNYILQFWIVIQMLLEIIQQDTRYYFAASFYQDVMFIHCIRRYLTNFVKNSGRVLENICIAVFASSDNTSMVRLKNNNLASYI